MSQVLRTVSHSSIIIQRETSRSRAVVRDQQVVATPTRDVDESESERIDRLGRERPPEFRNWQSEFVFCYSIMASQLLAGMSCYWCPILSA